MGPWPNDPQGPQARALADLYWILFGSAVVVLAIVVGALVVAGLRFRERPGHVARQYHGNNLLELVWTVVPTLMVITFAVLSFQKLLYVNDIETGETQTIDVEGKQWVWIYHYPKQDMFKLSDGSYLVGGTDLHVPVGQKIRLELTSDDVIHAFFIPPLGGQKDAVPGRTTEMWIQADRPGTYKGQCSEFCGTGHGDMLLSVVAQQPADYQAWAAQAVKDANRFNSPEVAKGKALFTSLPCAGCHTIEGLSSGTVGPNLTHEASKTTPIAGGPGGPVNEEDLRRWIKDPQKVKPGTVMPTLGLDDATVDTLVQFILTLK